MSQKIQVRRGTNAERQTVTFDQGEPVWAIDTKKLWVGDGSTAGGILAGGDSLEKENTIVVPVTDATDATTNGASLKSSLLNLYAATPFNLPRSRNNKMTLLLPPAKYELKGGGYQILSGEGVNLMGMTSDPSDVKLIIETDDQGSTSYQFFVTASHSSIRNITFVSKDTGYSNNVVNVYVSPGGASKPVDKLKIDNCLFYTSGVNDAYSSNFDIVNGGGYGLTNVEISNCVFLSGGIMTQQSAAGLDGAKNVRIDNCLVYDDRTQDQCAGRGLIGAPYTAGTNGEVQLHVSNSSFITPNHYLLHARNNTAFVPSVWENCYFSGTAFGYPKLSGPGQQDMSNAKFVNCVIDCGQVMGCGTLDSTSVPPIFDGCTFHNLTGSAVYVRSATSGIFNNCSFKTVGGAEHSISGNGGTAKVTNSVFLTPPLSSSVYEINNMHV